MGELSTDGYSGFGVIDWHQQTALQALDRDYAKTGIRPEFGVSQSSGTPFPANFFSDNGISGNPYFASGCRPPVSFPSTSNATCRYDFTRDVDLIPKTNQLSILGRFNRKFSADHTGALEYLHSRSTNVSRVAPPPMSNIGITMFADSPFYPGGPAGVPAFPGLTGEPLDISWRPLDTGRRQQFDASMSDRLLASLEGVIAGWDYSTGISHGVGRANSAFTGGYVIDQRIIDGVGAGILNPFGAQTPAGLAYLNNSLLIGRFLNARINSSAIDFKASRDLTQLPAGPLGFAIGGEWRHDKATYRVNRDLAGQASSSGYAGALDQAGSRNIAAIFSEVNVPVIQDLELNVAARYDRYSDVGGRFDPKVALRYQPTKQVAAARLVQQGLPRADPVRPVRPADGDVYLRSVQRSAPVPKRRAGARRQPEHRLRPAAEHPAGRQPGTSSRRNRAPTASASCSSRTPSFTFSADYWDIRPEGPDQCAGRTDHFRQPGQVRRPVPLQRGRHQPRLHLRGDHQPGRSKTRGARPERAVAGAAQPVGQLYGQHGRHLRQQVRLPERAQRPVHPERRALCRRHPGVPLAA